MSGHPIVPVRTYVAVFVGLLILTFVTWLVAQQDFGLLNTPVALGIAGFKAALVIVFFMGVRYNTPLTKTVVVAGFGWLIIMFVLTMNDYLTRGWMDAIGGTGR
jgi:cytochrome c oxidase subunit 4